MYFIFSQVPMKKIEDFLKVKPKPLSDAALRSAVLESLEVWYFIVYEIS